MLVFFTAVLAVATIVLARATMQLANHTQSLATFTNQLVRIEQEREKREEASKRERHLSVALDLARKIQQIHAEAFAENIGLPGQFPSMEADLIRRFSLLVEYTLHADCANDVKALIPIIDRAAQEATSITDEEMERAHELLTSLQQNLSEPISAWERELTLPIMSS